VNATPSSSSQWIADCASPVRISTRRRSAVSCELFQTSSACCSGESSSPNDAWIPPWAFAELQAWIEPLVARAVRAPARYADTAAASPEAPLPITSTSKSAGWATPRCYHRCVILVISRFYSSYPVEMPMYEA